MKANMLGLVLGVMLLGECVASPGKTALFGTWRVCAVACKDRQLAKDMEAEMRRGEDIAFSPTACIIHSHGQDWPFEKWALLNENGKTYLQFANDSSTKQSIALDWRGRLHLADKAGDIELILKQEPTAAPSAPPRQTP